MDRTRVALDKARKLREQKGVTAAATLRRGDSASGESNGRSSRFVPSLMKASQRVLRRSRVVAAFEHERRSDVFRMLRTQIMLRLDRRNAMIGVLSPRVGDGKTLTAVNLAYSLALDENAEVLLVDVDLRRPAVHRMLGISPDKGIGDYLSGEAELQECLVNPGNARLTVLPCRRPIANSSELIVSSRMKRLITEIKQRDKNQMVLFDMPPLLEAPDSLAFLEQLDAAIMVVSEGKTLRRDIDRSLEMMEPTRLLGTVLNRADSRTARENAYYYY